MARSNAEAKLARTINSTIEIVTDNYVNSTKFNNVEEVTETFNDLARTLVNQQLSGAITACERLTQKTDGSYVSYMAVELSGSIWSPSTTNVSHKTSASWPTTTTKSSKKHSKPKWPSSAELTPTIP